MAPLLFLSMMMSFAPAEPVLIPAPSASSREYQARLQGSAFNSPSQAYTSVYPLSLAREQLLTAYAEAQKAYLENSLPEAQLKFEALVAKVSLEDWGKNERELFLFSYLRLAQINSDRRDQYLALALQLGPGLSPDKTLFPPPLLNQFQRLQKELPKINPRKFFAAEDWQRLLINGVPCAKQSCPDFVNLPAPVRVTFLSDKWVPQTVHVALAELGKSQPEHTAWLQGSCGKPSFHDKADIFDNKTAFWGLKCGGPELKPVLPLAQAADISFPEPIRETRTPLYKNKWVWAGVGVVAAAVIISAARAKNGSSDTRTSTTYGF